MNGLTGKAQGQDSTGISTQNSTRQLNGHHKQNNKYQVNGDDENLIVEDMLVPKDEMNNHDVVVGHPGGHHAASSATLQDPQPNDGAKPKLTMKKKILIAVSVLALIIIITVMSVESEKYGFAFVLSKFIGTCIVVFSVFMKVPQIMKIWKETSVEGLTATMFYLDYLMLLQIAAYSFHQRIAITVYGESIFLGIQDIIIILQIWYYSPTIKRIEIIIISVTLSIYTIFLFAGRDLLTNAEWDMIVSTSCLLNVLSKGRQIVQNCYRLSTGQMAFVTFFLNWFGSLCRFYTVMIEAHDDFAYVFQAAVAIALTSAFMLQFIAFRKNDQRRRQQRLEEAAAENRERMIDEPAQNLENIQ